MLGREPSVGDAAPQNRVHLGHVGAPQHKGIGVLKVVVATHRLVNAKGAHETRYRAGHAVARVGVDVVGAKPRLEQFGSGITFPDRPLARAKHADGFGAIGLECGLGFGFHDVKGLIPSDVGKFTVFVKLAVFHAQQRLRQAVFAVHDLAQKVTLDAIEPLVHRCVRVALGGDNFVVFGANQHAAAGAAKTAHALVPAHAVHAGWGGLRQRLRARHADADDGSRSADRIGLDEFTTGYLHGANSCSGLDSVC